MRTSGSGYSWISRRRKMPCDREQKPFGYAIQHSNNPQASAWLVMRWGEIVQVCSTLTDAYLMLACEVGVEPDGLRGRDTHGKNKGKGGDHP